MRTVWKFPLQQVTKLQVPISASVNLVGLDPTTGDPALWVELDSDAEKVERTFAIYGTGHDINSAFGCQPPLHVGSVIHGVFVWHVYEVFA